MIAYYAAGRGSPPIWSLILEAAGYDPLRAMEIEAGLSAEWWERWIYDREQRIKAAEVKHGK